MTRIVFGTAKKETQKLTHYPALVVGTFVFGTSMHLTKYLLTEPLGEDHILMVNCLSGAVDIIEQKNLQLLERSKIDKLDNIVAESLFQRGYLFSSYRQEQEFLLDLENKYKSSKNNQVIDFVVCPTFDCNLDCPYCFQKNLNKRHLYLTKKAVPALVSALTNMNKMLDGKKAIQLFGGEPLLPKNKPFIEEILAYSSLKNIPVAITSNGTTIDSFKALLGKYKHIIKMAQITIDGPPQLHDKRRIPPSGKPTFDLIIRGIKYLLSLGVAVHGRVNVDKTNVDSLPELATILKEQGLTDNPGFRCSLAPVANHCSKNQSASLLDENMLLNKIENLRRQYSQMSYLSENRIPKTVKLLHSILFGGYSSPRFTYCQASRRGYFIFAPDGLIYPCSEAAGHPELAIGQFIPYFTILEKEYERWSNRSIVNIKKCAKCPIAPLCGGGCAYASHAINGDIYNPYCHDALNVIKAYIKANKDLFADRLNKAKIA